MKWNDFRLVRPAAVCVVLILLVWAVFGQTIGFGFINCDDDVFVYQNPVVLQGFSMETVRRVLTSTTDTFYYPLTVLSFMLDAAVYGMNPAGFHLTNVLLHTASVLLLFGLLVRLTGRFWPAALVAALFGIHPLQVEAVAWVTARKDVLSGVFFMLTLHAYLSYVRKPFVWLRYLPVLLLFLCGLMAKPMLVTLPAVLLLLDIWPLRRLWGAPLEEDRENQACAQCRPHSGPLQGRGGRQAGEGSPVAPSATSVGWRTPRVWLEKLPLFALSAIFSTISFVATSTVKTGTPVVQPSFFWKIGNGLVNYAVYLRQLVLPAGLGMPYPEYPLTAAMLALSVMVLLAAAGAAVWLRKREPAVLTGFCWYLGMLFPVSGMLRYLGTSRADRFVYLPLIGLLIAAVWGCSKIRTDRRIQAAVAVAVVLLMAGAARIQAGYWRSNLTLWTRSLAAAGKSTLAYVNLGAALFQAGENESAAAFFQRALELDSKDQEALYNLGVLRIAAQQPIEGEIYLKKVLDLNPRNADANRMLGILYLSQQKREEGLFYIREVLRIHPNDTVANKIMMDNK